MRIQITRGRTIVEGSDAEFDALRKEFDTRHFLLFRSLLEPQLLHSLQTTLESASFFEKTNRNIGDELRVRTNAASSALQFLMNDPALFAVAERLSGCPPIGCFLGRVYRLLPNPAHTSDWHTDLVQGRMLTMSVNLSPKPFAGGLLQIREAETGRMCAEVANTGPGDAVLFRISPSLQHRVTPAIGDVPRTAYAGWFLREPYFADELRRQLDAVDR
jgi:hypothetical protein